MTATPDGPSRASRRLAAAWRSGPLGVRGFRLLTSGQFASTIGDYCYAVALPWLVLSGGGSAASLGAVLTCVAVAAMAGALSVGKFGDRFRPATLVAGSLIVGAAGIAAAPFLGGLPGVAAGLAVLGIATGFDNVVSITMIQRWAPPALPGRVWGLLTLASVGSFPVATFVAGLLVRHLGPTPVFPISGGLLVLSMLYGLTQREFRDFGTGGQAGDAARA